MNNSIIIYDKDLLSSTNQSSNEITLSSLINNSIGILLSSTSISPSQLSSKNYKLINGEILDLQIECEINQNRFILPSPLRIRYVI